VTKSRRSFERNISSSKAYGITQPVFGTAGLMKCNISVENDDDTEDSNTSFETDLEEEKVRREKRLARTLNSLRDSSLTKSERDRLQKQARCEQWLIEQSKKKIRTARQNVATRK
jgi:hypothetical protein